MKKRRIFRLIAGILCFSVCTAFTACKTVNNVKTANNEPKSDAVTIPSAETAYTAAAYTLPTIASVSVSAASCVLMDAASGQILFAKDADTRRPMASTTKIMTALCAAEACDPQTVICVSPEAVGIEGSSVYLHANEKLTLQDLLYSLLLASANDAAAAIAIAVSGSISAFAERMNAKAASIGLTNTHFDNPHGLDSENHYTTARELAVLTREALQNPLLARIFATRSITVPQEDGGVRYLHNHNKLLRTYQGAIGVKTGFTQKSGRCLCSAATRDGLTLIAVTLDAPDDWADHTCLLDAGFAAYESVELAQADIAFTLPVTGGTGAYVRAQNTAGIRITLPKARGAMHAEIYLPHFLYAPVEAQTQLGAMQFMCDLDGDGCDEVIASLPLCADTTVQKALPDGIWNRFKYFVKNLMNT